MLEVLSKERFIRSMSLNKLIPNFDTYIKRFLTKEINSSFSQKISLSEGRVDFVEVDGSFDLKYEQVDPQIIASCSMPATKSSSVIQPWGTSEKLPGLLLDYDPYDEASNPRTHIADGGDGNNYLFTNGSLDAYVYAPASTVPPCPIPIPDGSALNVYYKCTGTNRWIIPEYDSSPSAGFLALVTGLTKLIKYDDTSGTPAALTFTPTGSTPTDPNIIEGLSSLSFADVSATDGTRGGSFDGLSDRREMTVFRPAYFGITTPGQYEIVVGDLAAAVLFSFVMSYTRGEGGILADEDVPSVNSVIIVQVVDNDGVTGLRFKWETAIARKIEVSDVVVGYRMSGSDVADAVQVDYIYNYNPDTSTWDQKSSLLKQASYIMTQGEVFNTNAYNRYFIVQPRVGDIIRAMYFKRPEWDIAKMVELEVIFKANPLWTSPITSPIKYMMKQKGVENQFGYVGIDTDSGDPIGVTYNSSYRGLDGAYASVGMAIADIPSFAEKFLRDDTSGSFVRAYDLKGDDTFVLNESPAPLGIWRKSSFGDVVKYTSPYDIASTPVTRQPFKLSTSGKRMKISSTDYALDIGEFRADAIAFVDMDRLKISELMGTGQFDINYHSVPAGKTIGQLKGFESSDFESGAWSSNVNVLKEGDRFIHWPLAETPGSVFVKGRVYSASRTLVKKLNADALYENSVFLSGTTALPYYDGTTLLYDSDGGYTSPIGTIISTNPHHTSYGNDIVTKKQCDDIFTDITTTTVLDPNGTIKNAGLPHEFTVAAMNYHWIPEVPELIFDGLVGHPAYMACKDKTYKIWVRTPKDDDNVDYSKTRAAYNLLDQPFEGYIAESFVFGIPNERGAFIYNGSISKTNAASGAALETKRVAAISPNRSYGAALFGKLYGFKRTASQLQDGSLDEIFTLMDQSIDIPDYDIDTLWMNKVATNKLYVDVFESGHYYDSGSWLSHEPEEFKGFQNTRGETYGFIYDPLFKLTMFDYVVVSGTSEDARAVEVDGEWRVLERYAKRYTDNPRWVYISEPASDIDKLSFGVNRTHTTSESSNKYPEGFTYLSRNVFKGTQYNFSNEKVDSEVVVDDALIRLNAPASQSLFDSSIDRFGEMSFKFYKVLNPPKDVGNKNYPVIIIGYDERGYCIYGPQGSYLDLIDEYLKYFFGGSATTGYDADGTPIVNDYDGIWNSDWPLPKDIELITASKYEIEFIDPVVMLFFCGSCCIEVVKGTKFDEPSTGRVPTVYHRYLTDGWLTKYGNDIIKKYYSDIVIGQEEDFIQGDAHRNAIFSAIAPVVREASGYDTGNISNDLLSSLSVAYYTKPTISNNKKIFRVAYSFDDVSGSKFTSPEYKSMQVVNIASLLNDKESNKAVLHSIFVEFPVVDDFDFIYMKYDFSNLLNIKEGESIGNYINNRFTGINSRTVSEFSSISPLVEDIILDSIGVLDFRYFDAKLNRWMSTNKIQSTSGEYYTDARDSGTNDPLGILRDAIAAEGSDTISVGYSPFFDYSESELQIPINEEGVFDYKNVLVKIKVKDGFKNLVYNDYISATDNTYLQHSLILHDNPFEIEDKIFYTDSIYGKKLIWICNPPIIQHSSSDDEIVTMSFFQVSDPVFKPSPLATAQGVSVHGNYPLDIFRCLKSIWIE